MRIRPNVLVLGGTTEATALGAALADAGIAGTISLAGRVARPRRQPLPQREGGFGGADGLADYLAAEGVTHLIDATHPFAARISANVAVAAVRTGTPLIALVRPPWTPASGDRWTRVPDVPGAVAALDRPPMRVMLALGRQSLPAFAVRPRHRYLLRLVDPPDGPLPVRHADVVVDRGPFDADSDRRLLDAHDIQLIVSKNSGGTGARAKLDAARALGLPVLMIDRPAMPARKEVASVDEVMDWLRHADLGV